MLTFDSFLHHCKGNWIGFLCSSIQFSLKPKINGAITTQRQKQNFPSILVTGSSFLFYYNFFSSSYFFKRFSALKSKINSLYFIHWHMGTEMHRKWWVFFYRDVNGLKKKKRKSTTRKWIWKLWNTHFSILLFVLTTNTFDCWLYYLPTILAFYKSGWQQGCVRVRMHLAVHYNLSNAKWLLMQGFVLRYSRKFGLRWILWIMHPFGSSLHVIQHNSQETWREI